MNVPENVGAPGGAFFDGKEAARAAEKLSREAEVFRRRLAMSTFGIDDRDFILAALNTASNALADSIDRVENYEAKPPFGCSESYWTLFRLFCTDKNRNTVVALTQIWDHLSLSYEMNEESFETLHEAISDWKSDVAEDAKTRLGLLGELKQFTTDGYAFIVEYELTEPAAIDINVQDKPEVESIFEEIEEESDVRARISLTVETELSTEARTVRQSKVVKILIERYGGDQEFWLDAINEFVNVGGIYKFKRKNSPADLCLDYDTWEQSQVASPDKYLDNSSENEKVLNFQLAEQILNELATKLRHVQQSIATATLSKDLGAEVNVTVRHLQKLGLVKIDEGSLLGGGKKKSKAKTQKVMRVSLLDQTTKEKIKEYIDAGMLSDLLESLVELEKNK